MLVSTCFELLRNSEALRRGELVLSESFVADHLREQIQDDAIKRFDLSLCHQHVALDLDVGKAGLLYRWTNSLSLRGADLNSSNRHVSFEQPHEGRVGPANFAARAVRFAPALIPKVGFIIKRLVRLIMDEVAKSLVNERVSQAAGNSGIEVDGRRWRYALNGTAWAQHPAFTTIDIPLLGARSLIGGVVVVKRLDLTDGSLRLTLGLHPEVGSRLAMLGPIAADLRSTLGGASSLEDEKEAETQRPSLFRIPSLAEANSLFRTFERSISESPADVEASVVDPEWETELAAAPVLDVSELGVDGADALDLLDLC